MFWGTQTEDDEERSFGGYTIDVDDCEKYTKQEIVDRGHLFWEGQELFQLDTDESYAVKLDDLRQWGRKKTIIYR